MWPGHSAESGISASLSYITPTAPVTKGDRRAEAGRARQRPAAFGDGSGSAGQGGDHRHGHGATSSATTGGYRDIAGDVDPLDRFPLRRPDGYLDLAAGHGTFVAGIVRQVAPRAEVTVYRAVDSDGVGTEVTVACEMIRAVKEGAQIINLSPRLPDAR